MPFDLTKLKTAGFPLEAFKLPASFSMTRLSTQSDGSIRVHLQARSREPINHFWWGNLVHDMESFKAPERIALDDSHDEEIGYASWAITAWGLELDGVVIPNVSNPAHSSNRIIYNLKNGIPQQSSIDFAGDYDVQILQDEESCMVNGALLKGPACVVRNWTLRACAICKEGADPNTSATALSQSHKLFPPSNILTKEASMDPKELAEKLSKAEAANATLGETVKTLNEKLSKAEASGDAKVKDAVEAFSALAAKNGLDFAKENFGKSEADLLKAQLAQAESKVKEAEDKLKAANAGSNGKSFSSPDNREGSGEALEVDKNLYTIFINCGHSHEKATELAKTKKGVK